MGFKCRDCKDTKVYQGLGAHEPCRSCVPTYDTVQRPPRLNNIGVHADGRLSIQLAGPVIDFHRATRTLPAFKVSALVDDAEFMRLIDEVMRTGTNLQDLLDNSRTRTITA